MSDNSLRAAVLEFIGAFYKENGEVPSVSAIARQVDGVYREKFYKLFPGRLAEACRAAGVEIPDERIESVSKATESRERSVKVVEESGLSLKLNAEQSRRVFGICHVEGSKDPGVILDEILERDEQLRNLGLTIDSTKKLLDFMDRMIITGWTPETLSTFLNSLGVRFLLPRLTIESAEDLRKFLVYPMEGMSLEEKITEMTQTLRVVQWFGAYTRGDVTSQAFLEAVNAV